MLFTLEAVTLQRIGPDGRLRAILDGLSLAIPDRGITCLMGSSGSGKSTILRLLNRLEEPTTGEIVFRGEPLRAMAPSALRRRVGLVLQSPVMLPGTVRENLEAGLRLRGGRLGARRHGWSGWGSPLRCSTSPPTNSPAARSSGSPWPVRSSPGPRRCCSTR